VPIGSITDVWQTRELSINFLKAQTIYNQNTNLFTSLTGFLALLAKPAQKALPRRQSILL
jgi:hypothetical protein